MIGCKVGAWDRRNRPLQTPFQIDVYRPVASYIVELAEDVAESLAASTPFHVANQPIQSLELHCLKKCQSDVECNHIKPQTVYDQELSDMWYYTNIQPLPTTGTNELVQHEQSSAGMFLCIDSISRSVRRTGGDMWLTYKAWCLWVWINFARMSWWRCDLCQTQYWPVIHAACKYGPRKHERPC